MNGFTTDDKLKLLCRLRWITILLQALCMLPAYRLGWLAEGYTRYYVFVVMVLCLYQLLRSLVGSFARVPVRFQNALLYSELLLDSCEWSALLFLTGGPWNPMSSLLYVHLGLGTVLLSSYWRYGILFSTLTLFFLLHVFGEPSQAQSILSSPVLLLSQALVSVLIWLLVLWMAREIEKQQRRMQKLVQNQSRIDHLRFLGGTVSGFAHKFATPLNTMGIRLDRLLRQTNLSASALVDAEEALASLRDARDHLRDLSLVSAFKTPAQVSFDLVDVEAFFHSLLEKKRGEGIRIHGAVRVDGGSHLFLPETVFRDCLADLIDNARESYHPRTDGDVEVQVFAKERGFLDIEILDRGRGWEQSIREHLGEPYVTTKDMGNGLGLYNAKMLLYSLGGKLDCLDRVGGGAVVHLKVPLEG